MKTFNKLLKHFSSTYTQYLNNIDKIMWIMFIYHYQHSNTSALNIKKKYFKNANKNI